MKPMGFVIRSLRYFRKQHLGVFLATVLSTAVLTGALIVGDSVVFSLKSLVDLRLGNARNILVSGDRFVTDKLSEKITSDLQINTTSVLYLETIAIAPEKQIRKSGVQLLGTKPDFWQLMGIDSIPPTGNKVVISSYLANNLNLKKGDKLLLRVRNADFIPVNAPFSSDDDQTIAIRVEVLWLADDLNLGRFSIRNDQKPPSNIFIDKEFIAKKIGLDKVSNMILADINTNVDELNNSLKNNFTIEDAGLILSEDSATNQIELTSKRIFIDDIITEKIEKGNLNNNKILTYFANSFKINNKETPYSFISAIESINYNSVLSDSGMIINSWLADDLSAKIGDKIEITYYEIGPLRQLNEVSKVFIVEGVVAVDSGYFNRGLMPDFPGLSDAESCGDWEAGIPIDLDQIRDKDEKYWDDYKGTPKAYVKLETGIKLWQNNYGSLTSIRFGNDYNFDQLSSEISNLVQPSDLGISFIDARSEGTRAATSGVDFGELFLSLSFFVILSALMLSVLIHSLNLSSRQKETLILVKMGLSKRLILKLRILESAVLILLASVTGGLLGIFYNDIIIWALNSVWNDAVHSNLLVVKILPKTIIIGILTGIVISLLTIIISTRKILTKHYLISENYHVNKKKRKSRYGLFIAVLIIIASGISVVMAFSGGPEINSTYVLPAGFLFLTGMVIMTNLLLGSMRKSTKKDFRNIFQLSIKNTVRSRKRSITVITMLAIGTFTIVVTGSNRLTFSGSENDRTSGTGGFTYWIETTIPILHNISSTEGRQQLNLDDEVFHNVGFNQFHSLAGDDASCLNLNQVQQPQLLGVNPYILDSLGAFSFATMLNQTTNPWLELTKSDNNNIIYAIADQTVIQWGLIKSIGDTLYYIDEMGDSLKLVLVAGLAPSVFQGNLLIDDEQFLKHYPSSAGSNIMLVDAKEGKNNEVYTALGRYLSDYGINITSTSQRLRNFYSVTNTYLSIFMILGSLGVLIGTIGFGIVIIRNLIDRANEINIYAAVGYPTGLIFKILVIENMILLIIGILIGLISAVIGILPSLLSQSFTVPGNFIIYILFIVFLNGMAWIIIPSRRMINKIKSTALGLE